MESSLASCAHSHFNQRRAVRVVPYSRLPIKQCPLVITGTDDIAGGRGLAEQRNCGAPWGWIACNVARWRKRYLEHRLSGIERDLPRGRPSGESGCGPSGTNCTTQ